LHAPIGARLGAILAFDANGAEKEMSKFVQTVFEHCELGLGTPTEEARGFIIWDTDTGKIIFQHAVIAETDTFVANLYVGDRGDNRYGNS
jgi:hypothetical protein